MADFVRVPESDWQDICDSVREKTGGADGLLSGEVAPAVRGIQSGGGGETMRNMISEVLSLVPVFDDTWTTAKFTLTSNQSGTGFTVPNPLGKEPSQIFVLKTDIDYSVAPQVIGGFNIGNVTDDNNNNRTFTLIKTAASGEMEHNLMSAISVTNWNMQSSAWGKSTASEIKIRSGDKASATLWLAGEYILAVK